MMKTYKKPVISIDNGISEGVYAASGAGQGTLNVEYYGVWDRCEPMAERVSHKLVGLVLMVRLH